MGLSTTRLNHLRILLRRNTDGDCHCHRCLSPHCVQSNEKPLANRGASTEGPGGVVLDSFLNQVKLEQHPPSEPVKRVLTLAAKAANHRRARDKRLRETLCWWIANDKTCPDADRCNFKHVVTDEKDPAFSGTGVSSPGPSVRQEHPKGLTWDSWNNSWDKHRYRDKWTDA